MAAQKPAARLPVSRAPTACANASSANCVAKMTMRKRQRVKAEERVADHEERALAPGANGALRPRKEQRQQQIVKALNVAIEIEPGEIVGAEPGGETPPVNQQADQRGDRPIGDASGTRVISIRAPRSAPQCPTHARRLGGRHGFIQVEIHAHRIARQQVGRELALVYRLAVVRIRFRARARFR